MTNANKIEAIKNTVAKCSDIHEVARMIETAKRMGELSVSAEELAAVYAVTEAAVADSFGADELGVDIQFHQLQKAGAQFSYTEAFKYSLLVRMELS